MKPILINSPAGGGKSTGLENYLRKSNFMPWEIKILMFPKNKKAEWNAILSRQVFRHIEGVHTKVANNIHSDAWHFIGMDQENFYPFMPNTPDFKLYQKLRMTKYFVPNSDEKDKIEIFLRKYEKAKKGRMDHDDYLLYAIEQVKQGKIEPDYNKKLIGIDEFQLLNYKHFEYIDTIYPKAQKIYLGDLNQMILSFQNVEHRWIKELKEKCVVKSQKKIYRHGNNIKNAGFRTFRCSKQKIIEPEEFVSDYKNEGEVKRVPHFLEIDFVKDQPTIVVARDNFVFDRLHRYLMRKRVNHIIFRAGKLQVFSKGEGNPHSVKLGTVWQFAGSEASRCVVVYDIARRSYLEALKPENFEEQLNIIYTMKTRAKDELFLVDSTSNFGYDKISSFKEGLY